ncbi:hypothetical protein [Deferribacter abyssi]|uniref:hypothetical protein n=1 Tax=Deferribacter abyssi TaxID=213806 RepID=UPI003C24E769
MAHVEYVESYIRKPPVVLKRISQTTPQYIDSNKASDIYLNKRIKKTLKIIEDKIKSVFDGEVEFKVEGGKFYFILKDADVDVYDKLDDVYDYIYEQPFPLVEKIFITTV